jgi:glycosyltransferase involved in cell wall biosynthesis
MWLVGYLFNNNGMGTWCWETAHALSSAGEDVVLLCASDVVLPGDASFQVLRVDPPSLDGLHARLWSDGGMLSRHGPRVVREAARQLGEKGHHISHVLLNSTEFFDETIGLPQYVVAWARGISLGHYLWRLRARLAALRRPRAVVRSLLSTVGWWRRDWFAYRHAKRVLAVSVTLCRELRARGVDADLLYPCTHGEGRQEVRERSRVPRLVTSAIDLDDPRKQVLWMVRALKSLGAPATLTLIGEASDELRHAVGELPFEAHVVGALPRDEALELMQQHDIFLFASALDDWGYVVSEAMVAGLAVVAPGIPPFAEMLGDTGTLYPAGDARAFVQGIQLLISRLIDARAETQRRAAAAFSREAFVARLREIVDHG